MAIAKPTLVIVPGGWQGPNQFKKLATSLQRTGHETEIVSLVTVGIRSPAPESHLADVEVIHNLLDRLVTQERKQVILISNAYGAIPASESVKGYEVGSQKAAAGGGVIGAIFISGFLAQVGESLYMISNPSENPPEEVPAPPPVVEETGKIPPVKCETGLELRFLADHPAYFLPYRPHYWLYHDLDEFDASRCISELQPHAFGSVMSAATSEAWQYVPCTYISCELDRFIQPRVQAKMLKKSKAKSKYPWTVSPLFAANTPFSNDEVLDELVEITMGHIGAIRKLQGEA